MKTSACLDALLHVVLSTYSLLLVQRIKNGRASECTVQSLILDTESGNMSYKVPISDVERAVVDEAHALAVANGNEGSSSS